MCLLQSVQNITADSGFLPGLAIAKRNYADVWQLWGNADAWDMATHPQASASEILHPSQPTQKQNAATTNKVRELNALSEIFAEDAGHFVKLFGKWYCFACNAWEKPYSK